MKQILSFLLLLVLTALPLAAQTIAVGICTYNVLNYGAGEAQGRRDAVRTVLTSINTDIFVVQDLDNQEGSLAFATDMQNVIVGQSSVGTDGPDSDNGIIYNSNKLELIGNAIHATALRDINEFVLHVLNTNDTIHLFTCNLTGDDAPADKEARFQEALILRRALDTIPKHHHSIVAGTLNMYSSSEPAYAALTVNVADPNGGVRDPINRPGNWHDNENFADVHTQSPRVRSFGGGTTGGLDDRFDFILLSTSLLDGEYRTDSYTVGGNDGQHFNDSINAGTNGVVSQAVAQALHDASDHLPVYLELIFQTQSSGVESEPVWRTKEMDLSMRKTSSRTASSARSK